ncbi:MAG: KGK domain-containing protein [Prochlorotrichaceae cyanobacterium]
MTDKDIIVIRDNTLKIGDFLRKLNQAIFNTLASDKISLNTSLNNEKLLSFPASSHWFDELLIKEDEPSLVEALNNPELISPEAIKNTASDVERSIRLQKKSKLVSQGITGELLQVGKEWKPCKVVVKMYIEVYVEEDELEPLPVVDFGQSPLDDIRQSLNNPGSS